jgi:tRNA(Ile)-lysidine synthase
MTSRSDRKLDSARITDLPLDVKLLKPGMRVAVGLSGGADSVALLCALHEHAGELGLVVHAAHLHHGLRGAEADGDLEFSHALATKLEIPFHEARVDTAAAAEPDEKTGKPRETIEEAARRLRYAWFRRLMADEQLDAVATAHTLDDQAETVLAKFLRGAWTEGLSGIHPKVESTGVLRPLLGTTRAKIEAYLRGLGQEWREDSTNRDVSFTRNRIRHELLPLLESWNPRLREHLAQMAELARDEDAWWRSEVGRLAPQMILPGRPVRGGGRATTTGGEANKEYALKEHALDSPRLAALPVALQRRLLRHAAKLCGAALDFEATEKLRLLALTGRAGQKLELAGGLRAERSPRELRLKMEPEFPERRDVADNANKTAATGAAGKDHGTEYTSEIPGEIDAPVFGVRLKLRAAGDGTEQQARNAQALDVQGRTAQNGTAARSAVLRNWRPGDRVRLRYSGGPRKVKEVLEKMRVTGSSRELWPVLEVEGRIVWMKGVELEPEPFLVVEETTTGEGPSKAAAKPQESKEKPSF